MASTCNDPITCYLCDVGADYDLLKAETTLSTYCPAKDSGVDFNLNGKIITF